MKLLSGGQQKLFKGKQWRSQTEWYKAWVPTPLTGDAAIAADHYSPTERAADDSFARLDHAAISLLWKVTQEVHLYAVLDLSVTM
jgi:hypothetical protein